MRSQFQMNGVASQSKPAKTDLNKKSLPKQKTIQNFTIDAKGFRKRKNENHGWQISWHWLADNSHFPCGTIFIFCFSEHLGINIEGLHQTFY